jgi:tyrosyl-tRNA synthetase
MRMIQQGAVKIDGEKVEDKSLLIKMGVEGVFQVGKRKFARISTT